MNEPTASQNPSFIEKVITLLNDKGLSGLYQTLFRKLIYKRQTISLMGRNLNAPIKQYRAGKRWTVKQLTVNDLALCRAHFNRYIEDYKDLFAEGFTAFAAFENSSNEVIALVWFAPRDFFDQHYHHYTFQVGPNEVFQFAGEVTPKYRNTQISINVMQAAWQYWNDQGKEQVTCSIDASNQASFRLMFHVGWQELGQSIHFYRLLGFKWQTTEAYDGTRYDHYRKKKHTPAN